MTDEKTWPIVRGSLLNDQAEMLYEALKLLETHHFMISTKPYMNGRERGFVLSVLTKSGKFRSPGRYTHFAFFEHRNTDALCCVRWEGDYIDGCATSDDIPESVYPDKWAVTKSWSWLDIGSAVNWITDELDAIPQHKKSEKTREAA